ncbi:universal stress protein [Actinocatenispora thailandica]|uniref:Universal stress protein n=1 Tax=Actinocatenispora thailandica TaxID=227318 RepID=A0A7R7DLP6_9ACTN|nr:universal stress protein [Actinocatenispora thailandica]BCJ34044.1 universal stress protein [Actinocatenispora thailandica]
MGNAPIVVGVDGSSWSEAALDWAAAEAVRRDTTLTVLYAFEWPIMGVPFSAIPTGYDPRQPARRLVLRMADRARALVPSLQVTSRLENGPPVRRLLSAADRASLVVVGSRGLGGFSGLVVGSVSLQVAEHCDRPVVVVRGDGPARTDGPVVVGVDGPAGDPAIGWAFEEAAARRTGLVAVRVWPTGPTPAPDPGDPAERDVAAASHEQLERWHQKYPQVPLEMRDLRGHAAALLAEQSAAAQLVVVGARGRGGFAGLLLGSVSQGVLRQARCPVAVVRDCSA